MQELNTQYKTTVKVVKYALISIVTFILLWGSVYQIDEGECGIVLRNGTYVKTTYSGFHFKVPFIDDIVELNLRANVFVSSGKGFPIYTKDTQSAVVKVSVQYVIARGLEIDFYRKYKNLPYFNSTVDRIVPAVLEQEYGQFEAGHLVNKKSDVLVNVTKRLKQVFPSFIVIEQINLEGLDFNDTYEQAVEKKMAQEQLAQQKQYELDATRVEEQKKEVIATVAANNKRIGADAEAYQIGKIAEAESIAIKKKANALNDSPNYIEYVKTTRWSGTLPSTLVTGSDKNLLLNIN